MGVILDGAGEPSLGFSTEPESRRADALVGEVRKIVRDGNDEQRMKELLSELSVGLRDIKKALGKRGLNGLTKTNVWLALAWRSASGE
jgi:hypothetical protein